MVWGTFTLTHIITLFISAGTIIGIYYALKNRGEKTKTITLFILSLVGISGTVFNLVYWDSPIEYLPFHMCSINAILLPFTVLSKSKVMGNLTLIWSLGAALALIFNYGQAHYTLDYITFYFFYIPHTVEFAIPVLLIALKMIKFDIKNIFSTSIITAAIYTAVHLINLAINDYCIDNNLVDWEGNVIQVNYMYSLGGEGNLILETFRKIIPYDYWYMYLAFPLIAVYLFFWHLGCKLKSKLSAKSVQHLQIQA